MKPDRINAQKIIRQVAVVCGVDVDQIKSRSRIAEVALARQVAMYLMHEINAVSYPKIARIFSRDHTTVMHACKQIAKKSEIDVRLKSIINATQIFFGLGDETKFAKLGSSANPQIESIFSAPTETKLTEVISTGQNLSEELIGSSLSPEMSEREKLILKLFREGKTLEEIASEFGVTRERIRQISEKAMLRELKARALEGIRVDIQEYLRGEKMMRYARRAQSLQGQKDEKKEKRWSRYYLKCRGCGTASVPHKRQGFCQLCAGQVQGERRERIIAERGGRCEQCGLLRGESYGTYGRDLYITSPKKTGGSPRVLCRGCFQKLTGEKMGKRPR